jgi:hypothetical protein
MTEFDELMNNPECDKLQYNQIYTNYNRNSFTDIFKSYCKYSTSTDSWNKFSHKVSLLN